MSEGSTQAPFRRCKNIVLTSLVVLLLSMLLSMLLLLPTQIEHGWRHQNRQWHGREELKKVGTTYGLGRTTAKRRKEAIDSYVSK